MAGRTIVYGVNAENMVDYVAGTLLGDHCGPAGYAHVADTARGLDSLASAMDEISVSYILMPTRASSWRDLAAMDPRLLRIYGDDDGVLYRVLPAARPPDAAGQSRHDESDR